jgi:hypothetical protein
MTMNNTSLFLAVGLASSLALPSSRAEVDFVTQVAPVLEKHCVECHGAEKSKGKLRLDSRAAAFKSEGVLIAGKADDSEFFKRITLPAGDDDLMPAEGDPLPKEVQDILRDWINEGAKWPEDFVIAGKELAPRKEIVWPPDHQPTDAEKQAIQKLNGLGIAVRPIALNSKWLTANLRVFSGELNDEVLGALGQITGLVDLNLASTAMDDAKLAKLAGLKNLMALHLENTKVTDAGLKHLAGMAYLNYLNLYGTTVTDAGLDWLKDLKRLEKLYAWQTQVTAAGVARLKEAIPAVDVNTGASLIVVEEKQEEKKEEEKK